MARLAIGTDDVCGALDAVTDERVPGVPVTRDSKMMNLDTYILAIQQFLGKVFRWG